MEMNFSDCFELVETGSNYIFDLIFKTNITTRFLAASVKMAVVLGTVQDDLSLLIVKFQDIVGHPGFNVGDAS